MDTVMTDGVMDEVVAIAIGARTASARARRRSRAAMRRHAQTATTPNRDLESDRGAVGVAGVGSPRMRSGTTKAGVTIQAAVTNGRIVGPCEIPGATAMMAPIALATRPIAVGGAGEPARRATPSASGDRGATKRRDRRAHAAHVRTPRDESARNGRRRVARNGGPLPLRTLAARSSQRRARSPATTTPHGSTSVSAQSDITSVISRSSRTRSHTAASRRPPNRRMSAWSSSATP